MVDRTVTVRLRLDATQWAAGQRAAATANDQLSASARAAATAAERSAQRTATAVEGTFRGMATAGQAALSGLDAAAARSSQALRASTSAMSRETAAAATTAARATSSSSAAAAAATRQVTAAASEIPAAFRAASTAGTTALAQIDAAAAASQRTIGEVGASMSAATAAAAAGTNRLNLANRLALAEAAQASRAAAGVAVEMGSAFARAAARVTAMGSAATAAARRSQDGLKSIRTSSLALATVFGAAVYESSKFESAMSRVKAATQAPANELGQLRNAAIQAGSSTQYSATQSADAITELAKAGVSTADILGGALSGTLNLAAAGEMSVSDSAVVAAKAMNSFGLSGKDMAHIADVIAAAAGKSATDVHGMSLAFAQSSLLAHQTGLTLEQTAGALALFAQNGLVGSDAGTSLKTMLMRLTPQSQQAQDVMSKLGFSAYDAQGRFVGLSQVAARMQKAFGGLTPEARNSAMGIIFGSDAIRAATIVTQAGAQGIDTWTRAANDQGYASKYAATQADNLAGDLRRLQSALETALIQSGTAANGVMRDMAKVLTSVVHWYSSLPSGVQQSVTVLSGMVGVVGLIASGLLLLLPRIAATRTALGELGLSAATTRTALAGVGQVAGAVAALSVLSVAAQELQSAMEKAKPSTNELADSIVDFAKSGKVSGALAEEYGKNLGDLTDAIDELSSSAANNAAIKMLDKIGSGFGVFGKTEAQKAKDTVNGFDQALAQLATSGHADLAKQAFDQLAAAAKKQGDSVDDVKKRLPLYADALAGLDTQSKLTASGQKQLSEAEKESAATLQDTRTEVQKLTDALDALNGVNIDVASSEIQFRQSLADMRKIVKDNGTSLDITSDKGRKVKQGFLDLANSALKNAEAVAQQKNSQEAGNKALSADIALLKQQMVAMGFSRKTVDDLLKSYLRLPGQVTTTVSADTGAALRDLQAVQDKLAHTKGKSITVSALTASAEKTLTSLGYHVTHLPNGKVQISVPTGSQIAAVDRLRARIDALTDRTVTLTIRQNVTKGLMSSQAAKNAIETQAHGSVRYYAGGGTEQHVAQIARPGEWRVWAEDETGGEAYIPLAASKRLRSRAIAEETVRRLGGKGIAWNAAGSVRAMASGGFTYSPADPTATLGVNAGWDRYDAAVSRVNAAGKALTSALADAAKKAAAVRAAEENLSRVRSHHHTATQLAAAEERLAKARQASAAAANKVSSDRRALNAADAAAGVRSGTRSISGFNLAVYEKQLAAANSANAAWERNLATVGRRAGSDVEAILRGMGSDGAALVAALAKATGKQFTQIVNQLKALGPTAKASLADYTRQLTAANKGSAAFQANLLKLAAMGDTALAAQLAAQGDDAAAAIAAQAVKSPSAAGKANAEAKANASLLTSDDLANAVTLLGVLRSKKGAGIAQVLAAGLDWDTVRTLAPKIAKQIKAIPGSSTFVGQMRGQGVAMARGGLLTQPTTVLAAEAGSPEWWIPQNGSARSAALLSAAASGMGYHLVPAGRWAGAGGGGTTNVDNSRTQTVVLNGAQQSLGEQRADLLRHMTVLA